MLAAAKMFTRLAANAHLLLMCILVGRQHSRAGNNIYNGCLLSPRYHSYLQHISALLNPPTSHCKLELDCSLRALV